MTCSRHPDGKGPDWCMDCHPERYRKNPYRKHDGSEMPTEIESAEAIHATRPDGPIKPNTLLHKILWEYRDGGARTAYDASHSYCGDWHAKRRETRRLYDPHGYLELCPFTLPNRAVDGRPAVEAWRITPSGLAYLTEHGEPV